jgi:Beige/BEACH domain
MYGSHYSTMMGVVLHFLVRLQPFASLHREMQSGHFDVPDRLFSSIPRSFKHNTTQLSEVKELTPEWFTTPEMFRNVNNFDFGQTQDGDAVGDVMLPPWAASAEEFVRINREAMESDYVSDHLQEWIDLIFGYKQRGPAAVEANNVFYYLTYSGSVNRDVIINESLRRATELQVMITVCMMSPSHMLSLFVLTHATFSTTDCTLRSDPHAAVPHTPSAQENMR